MVNGGAWFWDGKNSCVCVSEGIMIDRYFLLEREWEERETKIAIWVAILGGSGVKKGPKY